MALATSIALPERYRVERHVASGGMASVWAALDTRLGRPVAVKVLAQHIAADEAARRRFTREARTAARVSDCQHVVTVYDVGEHEGRAFIVMELFRGGTVADRLRGDGVGRATALRWLREAAIALDCAHGQGIVHRDVKPANLLLDARERLAVGDFGIARLADDTQLTQTGTVLGTAAYLSPEQALGRPATEASDRYALAVVAWELLCGRRPFAGDVPAAQARQHVEAAVPPASREVPGLPRATDDVLAWGMAKAPEERPPTAGRFVAALADALGPLGEEDAPTRAVAVVRPRTPEASVPRTPLPPRDPTTGARTAVGQRTPRPAPPVLAERPEPTMPPVAAPQRRGRRWLAPVAALAALALAGGGAAVALTGGDPDRAAPEPTAQRDEAPAGEPAPERSDPPAQAEDGGGSDTAAGGGDGSASGAGAPAEGDGAAGSGSGASGGGSAPGSSGSGSSGSGSGSSGSGSGSSGSGSGSSGSGSSGEGGPGGSGAPAAPAPQPAPAPAPTGDPVALNDQGFALNRDGRFAEAVPVLQAAVEGFRSQGRTGEVGYAYALYNLGRALHRSGRSDEAIPVLEERLRFPNQRGTVRAELRAARRAAERA